MIRITVPRKIINAPALEAELRAAAGAAYDGWSYNKPVAPDVYTLHFNDGAAQAAIDAALQAYAAHDPAVLTAEQQLEARRAAAEQDLRVVDFKQVLQAINALAIPQEAKTVLRQILLLQYKSALATGIIDTPDPTQ